MGTVCRHCVRLSASERERKRMVLGADGDGPEETGEGHSRGGRGNLVRAGPRCSRQRVVGWESVRATHFQRMHHVLTEFFIRAEHLVPGDALDVAQSFLISNSTHSI